MTTNLFLYRRRRRGSTATMNYHPLHAVEYIAGLYQQGHKESDMGGAASSPSVHPYFLPLSNRLLLSSPACHLNYIYPLLTGTAQEWVPTEKGSSKFLGQHDAHGDKIGLSSVSPFCNHTVGLAKYIKINCPTRMTG